MLFGNRNIQSTRYSDHLGNSSIEKHQTASLRGLLKQVNVSGEQKVSELERALPGSPVAADTNLVLNYLPAGLIDAIESARSQRIDYRRLAAA